MSNRGFIKIPLIAIILAAAGLAGGIFLGNGQLSSFLGSLVGSDSSSKKPGQPVIRNLLGDWPGYGLGIEGAGFHRQNNIVEWNGQVVPNLDNPNKKSTPSYNNGTAILSRIPPDAQPCTIGVVTVTTPQGISNAASMQVKEKQPGPVTFNGFYPVTSGPAGTVTEAKMSYFNLPATPYRLGQYVFFYKKHLAGEPVFMGWDTTSLNDPTELLGPAGEGMGMDSYPYTIPSTINTCPSSIFPDSCQGSDKVVPLEPGTYTVSMEAIFKLECTTYWLNSMWTTGTLEVTQ